MNNHDSKGERAEIDRAEAAAYRLLARTLNLLLRHVGDDRKVNVSSVKRALAKAAKVGAAMGLLVLLAGCGTSQPPQQPEKRTDDGPAIERQAPGVTDDGPAVERVPG